MASVHQRPRSKYWHAAFRASDGRLILRSTKQTDRNKAMAVAIEVERAAKLAGAGSLTESQVRKILADLMERTGSEPLRCPSVREYLTEWLNGKAGNLSEGSARVYGFSVKRFLDGLKDQADKQLTGITSRHVDSYVTARRNDGAASSTIASELSTVIRPAFRKAMDKGLLLNNPAAAVDLPKGEHNEREPFTMAEVAMLVNEAQGEWKTAIMLGYFTGARLVNCCCMKWDNVDLINDVITFIPSKQHKGKRRALKVPILSQLKDYLLSLASNSDGDKAGYLCPILAITTNSGRNGLTNQFKAIMRSAGLEARTVENTQGRHFSKRTFHSLRHTCASVLANAGIASEVRKKITGHKSESVHAGYTHLEVETVRKAMLTLPELAIN